MSRYTILRAPPWLLTIFIAGCSSSSDDGSAADTTAEPAATRQIEPAARDMAVPRSPSPEGAKVFFVTLQNGAVVSSPFPVEFGISGMDVVRAGENVPDTGHHHILIDTDMPDLGLPVPTDDNHVHFGDASLATELTLRPGEHTLQLLLADHLHIPHDPPVYSERITILVE